jgi:hypothetical protein
VLRESATALGWSCLCLHGQRCWPRTSPPARAARHAASQPLPATLTSARADHGCAQADCDSASSGAARVVAAAADRGLLRVPHEQVASRRSPAAAGDYGWQTVSSRGCGADAAGPAPSRAACTPRHRMRPPHQRSRCVARPAACQRKRRQLRALDAQHQHRPLVVVDVHPQL